MKFILLALSLTLLPDIYIWCTFVQGNGFWWSLLYWLPFTLIILSMVIGFMVGVAPAFFMKVFFFLVLCTAIPKLLFALVSLFGRVVNYVFPHAAHVSNVVGIVVAAIALCGVLYGLAAGWKKLTVKEMEVYSGKLPQAFHGYRIVQLSDLHISTYNDSPETVDKLVDMVNAMDADAVVFTGDLVNLTPDELDPFMNVLSRLNAKDGVYSVLGNHDYCVYGRTTPMQAARHTEELKQRQKTMGWDLLLNENRVIRKGNDSIVLVGVENDGTPPFPSYADMNKALLGTSDGSYKVLLSHDPTHWRREVLPQTDIDLTLSGHTHSMQFRIGNFSPSMWTYDEWGGTYQEGERALHVNTGTGSNIPFRLGAWPEITLITLRSSQ